VLQSMGVGRNSNWRVQEKEQDFCTLIKRFDEEFQSIYFT